MAEASVDTADHVPMRAQRQHDVHAELAVEGRALEAVDGHEARGRVERVEAVARRGAAVAEVIRTRAEGGEGSLAVYYTARLM